MTMGLVRNSIGFSVLATLSFGAGAVLSQETHPYYYCWYDIGEGVVNAAEMCGGSLRPVVAPVVSDTTLPIPRFASICSQFATQGEAYYHVYVIGSSPQTLDADNDGQPCEELPDELRGSGSRVATYSSNILGDIQARLEVWQAGNTDFYLVINFEGYQFSTVNFSSLIAAQSHLRTYYGWVQGLD